jgi:hypothetical protein
VKKLKQRQTFIIALVIVLSSASFIIMKHRSPTLTGYEDANGVIYECSRPIKAKGGTAKLLLGHPQGLIPVNSDDASKYCHSVGIE